jgi:hypothetical protein
MHFDRLHELISRHSDGLITADEHHELSAMLEADPAARRAWFLRNDIDIALTTRAEGRRDVLLAPGTPPDAIGSRPLQRRFPAAGRAGPWIAAAGVIAGIFGASAVWVFALPRSAFTQRTIRVFSEGFEGGEVATVAALPRGLQDPAGGVWRGDEAKVVTARQGITPSGGSHMLAFGRSTFAGEHPSASGWCDVYRFVDGRPFLALAEPRPVTARVTARFSIAPGGCIDGEAYSASVRVYAFASDISDAPHPLSLAWVLETCIACSTTKVPLEWGQTGWRRVAVDAPLPAEARFLLLHVSAVRDEPRPTSEPATFRGHFVDDVTLDLLVNEPVW